MYQPPLSPQLLSRGLESVELCMSTLHVGLCQAVDKTSLYYGLLKMALFK